MAQGAYTGLEIAVIGMAGRFPGASNVDELWANLLGGVESISRFSEAELRAAGVDESLLANPAYVRAAGVVEGADRFDATFFGYSPREAALIDPQQRVFLQTAWAALEHAGYAPGTFDDAVGVYAGVGLSDYLLQHVATAGGGVDHQAVVANDKDFVATRVSYKLDLQGPSLTVQTACSTSLVAVHMACQALLAGECAMALAGGFTIHASQRRGYLYQEDGITSPDGHCRAFSERAQGCVPGSGGGIVVLKPLARAITDRDTIHAVIKGSAINNDGAGKVGYTAPGPQGQVRVIRAALGVAGVTADRVGYLEAHGTGTLVGDPIEIAAATEAFRHDTDRRRYCGIGSVKPNVGHLDVGAGVTGFIKAVLTVRDGVIPPSLHSEPPNSRLAARESPFVVSATARAWRPSDGPRIAGVSAFGIGGTNAHVVLEEPPLLEPAVRADAPELLVLSAKSAESLDRASADLAMYLERHADLRVADVSHTLRCGRATLPLRRAVVCRDAADAIRALRSPSEPPRTHAAPARVVFLFPGQGSQYVSMAAGLARAYPEFRQSLDRSAEIVRPLLGFDLGELLDPASPSAALDERLRDTRAAQPAIFCVSHALAQLVMHWGVRPAAMVGHSLGEYVAACLAGVMTLEDALRLLVDRGALVAGLPRGAMASVPLSRQALEPLLPPEVTVAAVNASTLCTVSGEERAVEGLLDRLRERGITGRRLATSHAFHSPMIDDIVGPFAERVSAVRLRAPSIPYLSNVTGTWITDAEATDPDYYARHLRQPVLFSDNLSHATEGRHTVMLELGPGHTLTALARRHAKTGARDAQAIPFMRRADDASADHEVFLDAVGHAWTAGVSLDLAQVPSVSDARRVPLPTYAFRQDRHWIDTPTPRLTPTSHRRPDVAEWFTVPSWQRLPSIDTSIRRLADPRELWVVLLDSHGVGADIASRLRELGGIVVTVSPDVSTRGDYQVTPGDRLACRAAMTWLRSQGRDRVRLVHCSTVDTDGRPRPALDGLQPVFARGFFSLLSWAQALGEETWLASWHLAVITSQIHDVLGGEPVWPEKATVLGPCRTIPLEYGGVGCVAIDVRPTASGTAERRTSVDLVVQSLIEPTSSSDTVAVRGAYRWRHFLAPTRLGPKPTTAFKTKGTYLITGGLGGVGLALAEYLGRTARAKLLLVSRSGVPPRQEWNAAPPARHDALDELRAVETGLFHDRQAHGPSRVPEAQRALDALCTAYALQFFEAAGIDLTGAEDYGRADFLARCGVLPKFERYVDAMWRMVSEDGYATLEEGRFRFNANATAMNLPAIRDRARWTNPALGPLLDVLDTCGNHLHPALTGTIPALDLLFGEDTYEPFQRGVQAVRAQSWLPACEALIAALVARLVSAERPGPLRILEIGGGEGMLTRSLLPHLRGHQVEYSFTDLGRSFVVAAERRAAADGDSFMRFGPLDISRPPHDQGFADGAFDVVLAFNVLHATPDVLASVSHARRLLAPGGLLVLQESVRPERWVDLIWGLTDGWWAFGDLSRRRTSPLLRVDGWVSVLRDAGFPQVESYPAPPYAGESDTAVLVGVAPTAHGSSESTVAALQRIEAAGGEVEVFVADVSAVNDMRAAVEFAERRFGRIDGVVHAALRLHDGAIQGKTAEAVADVFRPKVAGTLAVKEALAGRRPDLFVMFSSLISEIGGPGQVDYCAASNFQDAFAFAEQGRLADRVLSIDWAAWREVGKALRSAIERGATPEEALPNGMSSAEGLDALERALATMSPQVAVSPEPLDAIERRQSMAAEGVLAPERAAEATTQLPPDTTVEWTSDVERTLAAILCDVLGVARVGPNDNFFDLGGDSVISLQFVARAKKAGLRLTNRQVFECQTVAALALVAVRTGVANVAGA